VPEDTPKTIPEDEMVAAEPETDQVPPAIGLVSVVVPPIQTVAGPEIGPAESGFTVTVAEATQPKGRLYEMMAVPGLAPVTTPDEDTVAIKGAELLHVPPGVASARVVVAPTHSV
jgi:hypothetical protein